MKEHADAAGKAVPDLDTKYDNLREVDADSVARYRDTWARSSEATRSALRTVENIPYGPEARHRYDLFLPLVAAPCPVVAYIHGGYWRGGDKSDASYVAQPLVAAGLICVVTNYRLAPGALIEQQVDDCRKALAHVESTIERWGGNRNAIHLIGHSAGAHLAAMMFHTSTGRSGESHALRHGCRSAALASGIFDLKPLIRTFLNEDLSLTPQSTSAISPAQLPVDPKAEVPILVGDREGAEYLRQSTICRDSVLHSGGRAELHVLDGEDHFSIRTRSDESIAPVFALALEFFGTRLTRSNHFEEASGNVGFE
ncbi:MAG: alpha/beta hydrolase [Dehalococcoidia bacterium]